LEIFLDPGMARGRLIAAVLVAAGLLAGGLLYWRATQQILVHTVPIERNVEVRVFGIGTVEAQILSKIGFQVAGRIVQIGADQGDVVKAGVLLAQLDDSVQRAKLMRSDVAIHQSAANLLRAQAQSERARTTHRQRATVNVRRQSLLARGSLAQEAADDAQAAEDIARSELSVVEADVAIAKVLQDDTAAQRKIDAALLNQHELRAPFDGRVIARHKELGSIANPGEIVFTLIAAETVWIRAYVDESQTGGLAVGLSAFVRLRSDASRVVEAEVVRIDQENDRVTEERRVYVRCRACSPQHQIRYLGEQAEVEIVKAVIPSGRFIPLRFVEAFDGQAGLIWVLANGRLAKQRVQFGERLLDGRIRIASELPANVEPVADSRSGLRVGRAARPENSGG
jgi:HlyD family secretion protein